MPRAESIVVTSWNPPAEIIGIGAKQLPADADLFVKPPPEIGKVVSANSDVKKGQAFWPLPIKLAFDFLFTAIACCAIVWAKNHLVPGQKPRLGMILVVLVPVCIVIIAFAFSFKKHWMAYIGSEGAAVYYTRGDRNGASGQWCRFADIVDVQITQTGRDGRSRDWKMECLTHDGKNALVLRGGATKVGDKIVHHGSTYAIALAIHNEWKKRSAAVDLQSPTSPDQTSRLAT